MLYQSKKSRSVREKERMRRASVQPLAISSITSGELTYRQAAAVYKVL